jgi:hypothetical protein
MQLTHFESTKVFGCFSHEAMAVRQLLQLNDEADDDPGLRISCGTHRQQMVELFIAYRILDLLALTKGIPGLAAVPSHRRAENLGVVEKLVSLNSLARHEFSFSSFLQGWKYMHDWKLLLQRFQQLISNMPQALPLWTPTHASQLTTLGRLLGKNMGHKICLNFQIAAMQLADIIEGVSDLDRLFFQPY